MWIPIFIKADCMISQWDIEHSIDTRCVSHRRCILGQECAARDPDAWPPITPRLRQDSDKQALHCWLPLVQIALEDTTGCGARHADEDVALITRENEAFVQWLEAHEETSIPWALLLRRNAPT